MSDAQYIKQLEEQNERLIEDNDRLRQENANLVSDIILSKCRDEMKKKPRNFDVSFQYGSDMFKYQTKTIPMTPTIMNTSV